MVPAWDRANQEALRATFGKKISIAPNNSNTSSNSSPNPLRHAPLGQGSGSKPPGTTQRPAGAGCIFIGRRVWDEPFGTIVLSCCCEMLHNGQMRFLHLRKPPQAQWTKSGGAIRIRRALLQPSRIHTTSTMRTLHGTIAVVTKFWAHSGVSILVLKNEARWKIAKVLFTSLPSEYIVGTNIDTNVFATNKHRSNIPTSLHFTTLYAYSILKNVENHSLSPSSAATTMPFPWAFTRASNVSL